MVLYLYIESGSRGGFLAAKSFYDPIESGCQGGFWATRKQLSYAPAKYFSECTRIDIWVCNINIS